MTQAQHGGNGQGRALLERIDQIRGYAEQSVRRGAPAHKVEQGGWSQLLKLGREALGLFFALQSTGDERPLGVSYPTAGSLTHKLLQAMLERDAGRKLSGIIQLDDVAFGGARRGEKPGRGSPNKVPFIAAVATNQEVHPIGLRMSRLSGFRKAELQAWAEKFLDPVAMVLTDGLACFNGIATAGLEHPALAAGGGPASVKGAMRGSYRNASGQHLPRYLAEFCYRFNRRFRLAAMLPRLVYAAPRAPPMPYRLRKPAKVRW